MSFNLKPMMIGSCNGLFSSQTNFPVVFRMEREHYGEQNPTVPGLFCPDAFTSLTLILFFSFFFFFSILFSCYVDTSQGKRHLVKYFETLVIHFDYL